jgi:hypothetical protein
MKILEQGASDPQRLDVDNVWTSKEAWLDNPVF